MKLGKLLLSIVIVSLIVSMAIPMAAAPKPPKPPGGDDPPADPAISYKYQKGGDWDLMVMNADGSNKASVFSADFISHATWSPDGNAIAVMAGPFPASADDLYRIDISIIDGVPVGSEPILIVEDIKASPDWSPLGDVIAFPNELDGAIRLVQTVPANGGTVETIYTAPEWHNVSSPSWSPDASKMAFKQGCNGLRSILVLDLSDGSTTTVLGPTDDTIGYIHWARTGDVLLYSGYPKSGGGGIYTIDLNNPTPQLVIENGNSGDWSPDDTQIVFHRADRATYIQIYTISTGEVEILTKGSYPEWSRA